MLFPDDLMPKLDRANDAMSSGQFHRRILFCTRFYLNLNLLFIYSTYYLTIQLMISTSFNKNERKLVLKQVWQSGI